MFTRKKRMKLFDEKDNMVAWYERLKFKNEGIAMRKRKWKQGAEK